jgi:predicted nucleic acid-binding protein
MVEKPRYIDVNIFVYWLGNHPEFGEIARKWIKRIESSPPGEYIASSLTIYEVLTVMAGLAGKNLRDRDIVDHVVSSITQIKGLVVEPIMEEDFVEALTLMSRHHLDYEDALHIAVATRVDACKIVSNDRDFDTTPIKREM